MAVSDFGFAFFENEIVPLEQARVSIMTNALQYGTGVFGGIRGYYESGNSYISVFRPEDHFQRILDSLKILGVTVKYSRDDLMEILTQLVSKNSPRKNCYIRPFAYASSPELSPNLVRDQVFQVAIYMIPLDDYLPTDKGLQVKVSSWRRISDNAIPARAKVSGAYINSALARKEAYDHGYDEAILLTGKGYVSEGSAENIFIVRNKTLITPPVTEDVLEGITRRTIMQLAEEKGIPLLERSINRTELYIADEAFFTGTGAQVVWISSIDRRQVGGGNEGEITKLLKHEYAGAVLGKSAGHKNWTVRMSV